MFLKGDGHMRVRKYHQNSKITTAIKSINTENLDMKNIETPNTQPTVLPSEKSQKQKLRKPADLFRKIITNPNLNVQLMIIVLTLASDNFPMDRGIDSMSSTVDKIRNITDVINNTMQSVKVAAEAPKQIRRLFETNDK
jgi:hypothetical protein